MPELHLVFTVGAIRCAIPAHQVREVAAAPPLHPIPWSRPPVLGLTALRGTLLPVVDARAIVDDHTPAPPRQVLVVLVATAEEPAIAVLADDVEGVSTLEIAGDEVSSPLPGVADGPRLHRHGGHVLYLVASEHLRAAATAMTGATAES